METKGTNLQGRFERNGVGSPPAAEMRYRPVAGRGANRMTSSRFQVPPRGAPASASVRICPVCMSTVFSLPCPKNPIDRLSGDQKGSEAPSVCASGCAAPATSSARV